MSGVLAEVLAVIGFKRDQVQTLKTFLQNVETFVSDHDLPSDYVECRVALPLKELRDHWDEADSHLAEVSEVLHDVVAVQNMFEMSCRELEAAEEILADLLEREMRQLLTEVIKIQAAHLRVESFRPFKNSSPASTALAEIRGSVEANAVLRDANIINIVSPEGTEDLFSHVESVAQEIERVQYKVIPASGTRRALIIGGLISSAAAIATFLLML